MLPETVPGFDSPCRGLVLARDRFCLGNDENVGEDAGPPERVAPTEERIEKLHLEDDQVAVGAVRGPWARGLHTARG